MKKQKTSAQAQHDENLASKQYPEFEDGKFSAVEDFKATYYQTPLTEKEEFRQSEPFLMIGWAKGRISNMTDDDLRLVRYVEKYGL